MGDVKKYNKQGMEETITRQEKFYRNWEEKRKKKWQYVLLHGTVYWGLFMTIFTFLWESHFEAENMKSFSLIIRLIVFGIGGIPIGIMEFNRNEKVYLNKDNAEIINGIKKLKAGKVWKYDNLIISNLNNETLVVRNKLFWFDQSDNLEAKLTECFNTVVADYKKINKEPQFEKFSQKYKVRIQVYEVLDNETPRIDKVM